MTFPFKLLVDFLALFSGAKSFAGNWFIGHPVLNRWGLHVFRVRVAANLASYRRFFLKRGLDPEQQEQYRKNGYTLDRGFLAVEEFAELRREVLESEWFLREMRQGGTVTRRVFLDPVDLERAHPRLAAFLRNPGVLARIRYVAGVGGAPIFSIQAVLSQADAVDDPQTVVHSDTFHSNAKAWFFLEDVREEDGPLAYVTGSHRATQRRLDWERKQSVQAKDHPVVYHARGSLRAAEADLLEMGLAAPTKMVVPENTLVVADTFGFHCRSRTRHATCRVEIYAVLRRNPFLLWTGLDLMSIPYVRQRQGRFAIRALSWLKKFGWAKMPWASVGPGHIKDPVNEAIRPQ